MTLNICCPVGKNSTALTACNHTDTPKQQLNDNTINTTNVSDQTNNGDAIGNKYGQNYIWGKDLYTEGGIEYYDINKALTTIFQQESDHSRGDIRYITENGKRIPKYVSIFIWNYTGEYEITGNGFGDNDCFSGTGVDEKTLEKVRTTMEKVTGFKLSTDPKYTLNYVTNHFNGHDNTELRIQFMIVE